MKTRILLVVAVAATMFVAVPRSSHAWSRPELNLAMGTTLGANGTPSGGGMSATFSPMWPVTEHSRFGVSVFADDIGSELGEMYDPNDHTDLGTTARAHRWTWGAAWRGDVDLVHRGRWTTAASGLLGWTRIEDDLRGDTYAAASAIGAGAGLEVRRRVANAQTLGVIARWQRLFAQRNASYRRVEHYASVALEWSWAAAPRP